MDEIVGEGLGDPVQSGNQCKMQGDTSQNDYRTLVVHVERLGNPEARAATWADMFEPGEKVQGLGIKAYYSGSQLLVVHRSHQLIITLGVFGRPNFDKREATIRLARAMLARLPG